VRVHGIVLTGVNMAKYQTYYSFFRPPSTRKFRKYYAAFD